MNVATTIGTREGRGKAIASQEDQIKKVNDNQFKVKSQSVTDIMMLKEQHQE
jgi:hypothetical protein